MKKSIKFVKSDTPPFILRQKLGNYFRMFLAKNHSNWNHLEIVINIVPLMDNAQIQAALNIKILVKFQYHGAMPTLRHNVTDCDTTCEFLYYPYSSIRYLLNVIFWPILFCKISVLWGYWDLFVLFLESFDVLDLPLSSSFVSDYIRLSKCLCYYEFTCKLLDIAFYQTKTNIVLDINGFQSIVNLVKLYSCFFLKSLSW